VLPAGAAVGAPARGGNGTDRSGISAAWIGAGGAVAAAIIGGFFLVIVAFHHSGAATGGGGAATQPSTPTAQSGVYPSINSISWHGPVNGKWVIEVGGTVQGLPLGEVIFVMVGRSYKEPPFYAGGPATVSGNGAWAASIKGVPGSLKQAGKLWPAEGQRAPIVGACPPACVASHYARERAKIAVMGPRTAFLTFVGPPVPSQE
jgi:hypothetical protein